MNNEIIGFIPARGGSKGFPGKNLKLLDGIPLIAHSILFSKSIEEIKHTFVSTDSQEIAGIAKQYGAEMIPRPPELATDESLIIDTLKYVLEELKKKNIAPKAIVLLQPTSPIRKKQTLYGMLELYNENKGATVITVLKKEGRIVKLKKGDCIPVNYTLGQIRQNIEPIYLENGNLYVLNPRDIEKGNLVGERVKYCEISEEESIDINTPIDLKIAEVLLKEGKQNKNETGNNNPK